MFRTFSSLIVSLPEGVWITPGNVLSFRSLSGKICNFFVRNSTTITFRMRLLISSSSSFCFPSFSKWFFSVCIYPSSATNDLLLLSDRFPLHRCPLAPFVAAFVVLTTYWSRTDTLEVVSSLRLKLLFHLLSHNWSYFKQGDPRSLVWLSSLSVLQVHPCATTFSGVPLTASSTPDCL